MQQEELAKHLAEEPELNQNAVTVLKKRYLKKDNEGNLLESTTDMFRRVAYNIAQGELSFDKKADVIAKAKEFYKQIISLKFLPNSPTLMNAGRELQQLSACFVLPVDDSLEDIFNAVKYTALIHKSGGGTGFSFSRLRPKDDVVKTTKGVSSGPVSFMTVFDAATETIKQGGTRRGANMGILRVDHPDIMDFIFAKEDKSVLTNFNISVGVTEAFMEAVKNDSDYNLINPKTGEVAGKLNAKEVFDNMVELAWQGGDPGIIFLDRVNRENPTPHLGEMESTNPCGEQPLLPYESCNLGSINLAKFINKGKISWKELEETVVTAVNFLDNVIEMNKYPIPQIEEMTKKNRKIGLGIMGWADMLGLLGIPYNSDEATELAEKIMKFIRDKARTASAELAKIRGNFPAFEGSVYEKEGFENMRNATVTTIAPTGTISIIGSCSSGIEPYFAIAFYRYVMDGHKLPEASPAFREIAKKEGFYSEELMSKIAECGHVTDLDEVPNKWQEVFVTSHEISPFWHVKMQAAFQKYTDNAVSKTVNFDNDATIDDVAKTYMLSYNLGCKGVTIYRDGSRDEQVLNVGNKDNKKEETITVSTEPVECSPKPRPAILIGKTIEMMTGCGKLYVTINQDEKGNLFEVFTSIGKAGGCAQSQCEAIGRLISQNLRSGGDPEHIVKQLKGISCHMKYGFGPNTVLSCSDAVGKALEKALSEPLEITVTGKKDTQLTVDKLLESSDDSVKIKNGACPECGGPIEYIEGCDICYSCGYSHCS